MLRERRERLLEQVINGDDPDVEQLGETPVQGNLDPSDLFAEPAVVRERTHEVIEKAGPAGHILNLGHGVNKDTPVESVEAFVETAKSVER